MISNTPRGFKDILPKEAQIREDLRVSAQDILSRWGYKPIETPTLEMADVISEGQNIDQRFFRLFDSDSSLLVLRPDITLAIARMVASRLEDPEDAYRFRYRHTVYRENDQLKGEPRELTQVGIELIGQNKAISDAEVIMLFCECIKSFGLDEYTIALSSVSILKELLVSCDLPADEKRKFETEVYSAYNDSDIVRLSRIVNEFDINEEYKKAISELIKITGKKDAIDKCFALVGSLIDTKSLQDLYTVWELLEIAEVTDSIVIDFSIICSFDYYTGFFMEAYSKGSGKPLGSGGRYDSLIGRFGKNLPAAGFSIYLENVIKAKAFQGNLEFKPSDLEIIKEADDAATFKKALEKYRSGKSFKIRGESR